MAKSKLTTEQRFWQKVDKNGPTVRPELGPCWVWTAGKTPRGYGKFCIRGAVQENVRAHRFSFEALNGPVEAGLIVCHRCDVPACVRPDHLFLGTNLDNTRDAVAKGRMCFGERHPVRRNKALAPQCPLEAHARGERIANSKLTAEDVVVIRDEHRLGMNYSEIGRKHGITSNQASNIVRRKCWTHVD